MYLIGMLALMVLISFLVVFTVTYLFLSKGKKRLKAINRYLHFNILSTSIILALLISVTIIIITGASFYFGLGSIEVQLIFIIWIIAIMLLLTKILIPVDKREKDDIKCVLQYKGFKIISYLYGLAGLLIILQFIFVGPYNLFNGFIVLLISTSLMFGMWKGLFKSKATIGEEYLRYSINILTDLEIRFEDVGYIELGKGFFRSIYIDIFYNLEDDNKEEGKIRVSNLQNMDGFIKSLVEKAKGAKIDEEVKLYLESSQSI